MLRRLIVTRRHPSRSPGVFLFLGPARRLGVATLLLMVCGFLACGGGNAPVAPPSSSSPAVPLTPTIMAPSSAIKGQSYSASTPAQAGVVFTWNVSGGTLVSGQSTSTITFSADTVGTLTLTCVARNSAGAASPTVSASVVVQNPPAVIIPPQGGAATLDIAEWNLEWFGDTTYGPTNENLQQQNVRDVIAGVDCDIWGLEEVVSDTAFSNLVAGLPGYAGLLASDPSVTNGSTYYSPAEQKVALLYKTGLAAVQSAQIILTANDYDFAGRPPMEVKLSVTLNGTTSTIYVVCLHAKAISDVPSWQRRLNASTALKTYLDTVRAGEKVFVLGDFNDDMDTSITSGEPSPYQNFVNDTAHYFIPTKALSDAHIATTVSYSDAIDHHIVSQALASAYIANSVKAFRADQYITNYGTTTTDHLPVLTRWTAP